MDWHPEPGETPLFRGLATFATGKASKVAGMRWFRDDEGRDIGAEIPGWPTAKVYARRGDKSVKTGKAFGFLGKATVYAVVGTIELLAPAGGSLTGIGSGSSVKPQDKALEVEDFPVLVSAFGTVARTAPWQLDPDRAPKGYQTWLQLTDQRLIVLGAVARDQPAEVLWQLPLDQISGALQHEYARNDGDVSIGFVDGSWIRLDLGGKGRAAKTAWVLNGNTEPVELTEAQQEWALQFVRKIEGAKETVATPVPDAPPGALSIEVLIHRDSGFIHAAGPVVIDAEGKFVPRDQKKK